MGEEIAFGFLAAGAIGFGTAVVLFQSPLRAAVALIGSLLSVAGLFLMLAAPFVAVIQVIVYASAIVVMFLFVIAYLGDRPVEYSQDRLAPLAAFGWLAVIVLVAMASVVIGSSKLPGFRDRPEDVGDIGSAEAIGRAFIDDYIVPFEAASLVLLIAALAAVLLARRAIQGEQGR